MRNDDYKRETLTEVELKRFSGHTSLRSLEVYIAHNREAAKHKAHEWERRVHADP